MLFTEKHPIIEYLVDLAERNNITVVFTKQLSNETPDIADTTRRTVIMNMNSPLVENLPFRLAHEIEHVTNSTTKSNRFASYDNYDSGASEERIANDGGVRTLLDHHFNNGGQFNYIDFMRMYGLPSWTENRVLKQMEQRYY